ncbi:MAG: hypothetical protein ABJE47_07285 [bacterium]
MEAMVTPSKQHVGIAISAFDVCGVFAVGPHAHAPLFRASVEPFSGDSVTWPSLAAALRELAATTGGPGGALSIALLQPLVEVRTLELPPLRENELQQLLARNAGRYFVTARGPQLIGIASSGRPKASAHTVVAGAASLRLVNAVQAAAREAGWRVQSIVPGESAWAAAAVELWPSFAKRSAHLLVMHPERTDLVSLRDGRITSIRKFRAGTADVALIAAAIGSGTGDGGVSRVGAVGPPDVRKELARALSTSGVTLASLSAEHAAIAERPDQLAATYASAASELALRTDDVMATRRTEANRLAAALALAAGLLLIAAAGVELWGVRRQLHEVQAQRAALHSQLSATLIGQTSVETAYRQLAALSAAERSAPRWTTVLVRLSPILNLDAYFTAFRGRGDSLVVDGIADHAALVFRDLERTPGLSNIGAVAPVRREAPIGSEATERFTIAAHLGEAHKPQPAAASPATTAQR